MKKFLFIFLISYFNSHAATIYVNAYATGSNNGLNWNNAYPNLQEALSNAIYGDEIWVAAGTYKATSTTDRAISFIMKNGVNLYGGFDGTETSITQRNISSNPTTLSGDIGALGDNSDNTNAILKITNTTSGLTIDGFRIISGTATSGCGGITLNNNTGVINLTNCYFYNNIGNAGAAVFMAYQGNYTVNISNSDFISNISAYGAINSDSSSSNNLNITNCKIKGSVSGGFAVLHFAASNLTMDKCVITNNTSTQSDIFYIDANSSARISNSLFVGNSYDESAIAFYSSSGIPQIVENVTISHNKKTFLSTFYTTVYSANGLAQIYNSIIYGNTNSSNNNQIDAGNTVSNSIVENGYATGTSILSSNPLFINPNNLNAAPFDCTGFDYKLQNNSQGINSGNNSYVTKTQDLVGSIRIQQNNVDAGAYENITDLTVNENAFSNRNMIYNYYDETIMFKNTNSGKIDIYDINGKLIDSIEVRDQLSLSHLKAGIYFAQLQNSNEKIKILKK